MTLSEMKRVLQTERIQLTRSLGQSFLHDGNQLRRIAAAAELSDPDRVLEIGPGLGPLTELLIEKAGEVLAIEKDRRLCDWLRTRFAHAPKLTLLHEDALDVLRQNRSWPEWKLVANLPYSVASPILVELAQMPLPPQRLVATLQWEVARRVIAPAGTPEYGLLALLLQVRYEPRGLFKIPASCFHPPPDVDSACVTLVSRAEPLLPWEHLERFTRVVKVSFSQRRKMMLKLLKAHWPPVQVESAFAELGLSREARAETVRLDQFVRLAHLLTESR